MMIRLMTALLLALGAAGIAAQSGGPAADAPWLYPRGARRDPVVPPAELYDVHARSRLQVRTIVVDPRVPRRSRAVVRLLGPSPVRAVVGAGDRVGAYRVVRVEVDRVIAVMHVLGADRSMMIPLGSDSARVGGSPR
jgi:hypothetical protein